GNAGTAFGPLLAAWVIVPHGQRSILVFTSAAFAGILVLSRVGAWYAGHVGTRRSRRQAPARGNRRSREKIGVALSVLLVLMFSKFFYLASMTNYYTFYLIEKFGLSIQQSQVYLFLFLFAGAAGTMLGGPLGDKVGRRAVIWFSVAGIAPFALALPQANLFWTAVLTVITGMITASAFPAILVYATELLPGKVGFIAGLFYGLAFGLAGIG